MMKGTVKVRKHPNYWVPRDAVEFLRDNSYIWNTLNDGFPVTLDAGDYEKIKKYVEVIGADLEEVKIPEPGPAFPKPPIMKPKTKPSLSEDTLEE